MCKNWIEAGRCNYGSKCLFAHGRNELVSKPPANSKYKSKLCTPYHESLYCAYGNRCLFIHDYADNAHRRAIPAFALMLRSPELKEQFGPRPRLPVFTMLTRSPEHCNAASAAVSKFAVEQATSFPREEQKLQCGRFGFDAALEGERKFTVTRCDVLQTS